MTGHLLIHWERSQGNSINELYHLKRSSQCLSGKESACSAGDEGLIPGSRRSPGEGNGSPLQYSCLENLHGQMSLVGYSPWGHKRVRHDLVIKQQQQSFKELVEDEHWRKENEVYWVENQVRRVLSQIAKKLFWSEGVKNSVACFQMSNKNWLHWIW